MTTQTFRVVVYCCLLFTVHGSLLSACAIAPLDNPTPQLPSHPTSQPTIAPTFTPTPVPVRYAVIGKARGTYWDAVERGTLAAEQQLGLPRGSVVFYAPDQDDPAAQIVAVEDFIAQKVRGIALAPSDVRALELSIRQARDAGIWLTTFDTDAPNSQRLFFVGTPQATIGRDAATALLRLLGDKSGKVAFGSTLLDGAAAERIAAFRDALKTNSKLSVLDATNDRLDLSIALQTARASIANHKDLVGAFAVYGYNSLAWCRAAQDANAAERLALIGFEATAETIACLKAGALDALVAPRPRAQGLQSVLALDSLATNGLLVTIRDYHFDTRSTKSTWQYDVGVDIISLNGRVGISLAEYATRLDEQNVPRDWQP